MDSISIHVKLREINIGPSDALDKQFGGCTNAFGQSFQHD